MNGGMRRKRRFGVDEPVLVRLQKPDKNDEPKKGARVCFRTYDYVDGDAPTAFELDNEVYASYQSIIQTFMMVSTLLMGFVFSGSLISMSYVGGEHFSLREANKLIEHAWWAFCWSLASLLFSFFLSVTGARVHSLRFCLPNAVPFFHIFYPLLLLSEIFLYFCGLEMLDYTKAYIDFSFNKTRVALCQNHHEYSFCADLGEDSHEIAKKLCVGPLEPKLGPLCKQLPAYNSALSPQKDHTFGYFPYPTNASNATDIVEYNSIVIGEALCYKDPAKKDVDKFCNTADDDKCMEARGIFLKADQCAGEKFEEILKCYRTCFSPEGDLNWYGAVIDLIKNFVWFWLGIRVAMALCSSCYQSYLMYRDCKEDEADPQADPPFMEHVKVDPNPDCDPDDYKDLGRQVTFGDIKKKYKHSDSPVDAQEYWDDECFEMDELPDRRNENPWESAYDLTGENSPLFPGMSVARQKYY